MAEELTGAREIAPVDVPVLWPGDVQVACKLGRQFAYALGFAAGHADEIGLVVTELASNLIRHASGGTIAFRRFQAESRLGMEIQSLDNGPGITDVERAIADGYS